MIYIDASLTLQAVLSGAKTTNDCDIHVFFYDVPSQTKPTFEEYRGAFKRTSSNGNTAVAICSPPSQNGITRNIAGIQFYNKDTVASTLTIQTTDGTTTYILIKYALATLKTLAWSPTSGWYVTP